MNDAGKVAFTPKGDYSNAATYEYLDTVVYDGNAYAALKTTTGNVPTDSDTDENWKLLARGGTSVPVAKEETTGVVKASSDIGVSDDGSMILETDYTSQESLAELTSGESRTTFFGKIAKAVSTLISHIATSATTSVLGHVKLSDSSAVTDSTGLALPATEKNASIEGTLANQISALSTDLSELFSINIVYISTTDNPLTVGANSYANRTVDISKDGYKPLGVVGFNTNAFSCFFIGTYVSKSSDMLVASIGNYTSVDKTLNSSSVFILYRKII